VGRAVIYNPNGTVASSTDPNLFFHDRLKDMIKSGGMNVSSQEVERVLHTHPDVLRAAVVAMPDPYWSEAVTAFVIPVPNTTPDPDEIIAFCRAHLAAYKVPKSVYLLDELPLDAQGKILKRELRTRPPAAVDDRAPERPTSDR